MNLKLSLLHFLYLYTSKTQNARHFEPLTPPKTKIEDTQIHSKPHYSSFDILYGSFFLFHPAEAILRNSPKQFCCETAPKSLFHPPPCHFPRTCASIQLDDWESRVNSQAERQKNKTICSLSPVICSSNWCSVWRKPCYLGN